MKRKQKGAISPKDDLKCSLVITTQEVDFNVHLEIVGSYYPFFTIALRNKNSGVFNASVENVIDCSECDSRIAEIALRLAYLTERRNAKKEIQSVEDIHDVLHLMQKWLVDEKELRHFANKWFEKLLQHGEEFFKLLSKQRQAVLFATCCDFCDNEDLHMRMGKKLSVVIFFSSMEEQLLPHPRALACLCKMSSQMAANLIVGGRGASYNALKYVTNFLDSSSEF